MDKNELITLIISIISLILIMIFSLYYFIYGGPKIGIGPTGPYNQLFIGPTGPQLPDINADPDNVSKIGPKGPIGPTGPVTKQTQDEIITTYGLGEGAKFKLVTDDTDLDDHTLNINNPFNSILVVTRNDWDKADHDDHGIILSHDNNVELKTGEIFLIDLRTTDVDDIHISSSFFNSINHLKNDGGFDVLDQTLHKGHVYFYIYLGTIDNFEGTGTSDNVIARTINKT